MEIRKSFAKSDEAAQIRERRAGRAVLTMPKMVISHDHTLFAGFTGSGATLSADAQLLAESTAAADHFTQQSLDILVTGQALAVSLITTDAADGGLPVVGRLLRDAAVAANADVAGIALTVRVGESLLPKLWRARLDFLGAGPMFVTSGPRGADWRTLWELRNEHDLRIAEGTEVTTACRLLAAEPATVVVPGAQVQAPVGSAWVSRRIWLPDYAMSDGQVDDDRLLQVVVAAVESAEADFANARWPTPKMRHDAWLNRRLAVEIAGIGSLVARLGLDPAEFSTLLMASRLVARVREALVRQSRRLAAERGPVPALEQAGIAPPMPNGRLRDGWLRRWREAVESSAQRHRNLLVLSPWSLFPEGQAAPYSYANLVPLLRYADACALPPPPDIAGWTLGEFVNFHRQVIAVLQQRSTQRQIAEPA
jgi:hypothetical protein